jgi:cytidine deaminase
MDKEGDVLEGGVAVFPDGIMSELRVLPGLGGVVASDRAERWLSTLGIQIEELMIRLVVIAATHGRTPLSGFKVGAVALGMPPQSFPGAGSLYLGSNIEFPGEALSFCVHAEQAAMNGAWLHGETGIRVLAVGAAPCGYCRQFLNEITTATEGLSILVKKSKTRGDSSYVSNPLSYFLPDAFGPNDLNLEAALMAPVHHGLQLRTSDELVQLALAEANASYAPYTGQFAGVALRDRDGQVFTGRYAENAAYNPSMSPLASALSRMNMSVVADSELAIQDVVLVEADSKISQRDATAAVLHSVAPNVKLRHFQVRGGQGPER